MVWLGILLLGGSMFLLGGLIVGILVFGPALWWGADEFAAAEVGQAPASRETMGVYASERGTTAAGTTVVSVEDDDGDDAGDALDPGHG